LKHILKQSHEQLAVKLHLKKWNSERISGALSQDMKGWGVKGFHHPGSESYKKPFIPLEKL